MAAPFCVAVTRPWPQLCAAADASISRRRWVILLSNGPSVDSSGGHCGHRGLRMSVTGMLFSVTLVSMFACTDRLTTTAPIVDVPKVPAAPSVPTDTIRVSEIAPGVRHTFRWEVAGPWSIHTIEVDLARCGTTLQTVKALDQLVGRETTTQLSSRLATRSNRPVLAAVNGDYFTSTGYPIGTQVIDGEPLRGYTSRPVFGVTTQSTTFFGADQLTGMLRSRRGISVEMRRINERPDTLRIALYNTFVGATTLADTGAVEVLARVVQRGRGVGDTVRAVAQGIDTLAAGISIPADAVVLAGKGRGAAYLRANISVGDTISWVMRFSGASAPIAEMIAGDPQLLRAGITLSPFAGTVAAERHPRTVIAVTADRRVLLVTVDGRQPGFSVGMTLVELTTLLSRLGAREAINVDGGGSTTMVVNGRTVNRPSDATGERPVANAIAVVGPAAGACR